MNLELAGKAILITGGTDGLGLALATQLASEGAAVGICGRDEERLRAAEETVQAVGGDVLAQRADVSRNAGPRGVPRRRSGPLGARRRGGPQRRARLGRLHRDDR